MQVAAGDVRRESTWQLAGEIRTETKPGRRIARQNALAVASRDAGVETGA
ncbi:MAG TPA: hypothetical protein VGJ18_24970 [Gemmatimonadaceae bacterium]